ncbi:hypothetical protein D1872_254510 [compost metagenome]
MIIDARSRTERTGNYHDIFVASANLFPVGDFTGINPLQLFRRKIVHIHAFIDDCGKRNHRHFIGDLPFERFKTRYVHTGVPVTGTDVRDALLHSLRAGNGAFPRRGDLYFRMQLLKLFSSLQRKRQKSRRAVDRNFPLQIVLGPSRAGNRR